MARRVVMGSVAFVLALSSCTGGGPVNPGGLDLPAPIVIEDRWQRSGHVLRPPPPGYEPSVDYRQAAKVARNGRRVLAGRLGLFTNKSYGYMGKRTMVDVPAWVITVRQCVPASGPPGLKDRPRCASDHLNVVVNAETGRYMQAFAP